ncbi:MAG TPA: NGG1p interacting factor NIF3 [Candidatus Omnitrophota bacterium]|nr:NGG1p interacting factor NIF3 [Candidatus Omnitrophota bacterium]HRZ15089.1 NGG1p interacting factor NIF3 [Candidatus Omnitrophota bacterium]
MKLGTLYSRVVAYGKAADPRREKKTICGYGDSAILYGQKSREIKKLLVGIDIDTGELLLADHIRRREGLDGVLSHHPQGSALACLYQVMQLQVRVLESAGMATSVGQAFLTERQSEVQRKVLPGNHMRAVDAARLLDIPFLCCHTPADNHAYAFIVSLLRNRRPRTTGDILGILEKIPEYRQADRRGVGPRIILGGARRPAGKILVEMTGGTEGHPGIYKHLSARGVRTIVCMHLSEEHFKKVADAGLNVIIAGHISSDTLGMNLILDRVEKHGKLDIVCCSGFNRVERS